MPRCLILNLLLLVFIPSFSVAEQRAATGLEFSFSPPDHAIGTGPKIAIDAGHNNFHTATGRYKVFTDLLLADGYQVKSSMGSLDPASLEKVDVLVIANALHKDSVKDWSQSPKPAFTDTEITILENWITKGGSLLLIADHQPFPGAAFTLARAFGFYFYNGYALDPTESSDQGQILFDRSLGNLHEHAITQDVESVTTFLGQAFLAPTAAQPLLSLDHRHALFLPKKAGAINNSTRSIPVEKWLQGAALKVGRGRMIVLGEAGGFTAQTNSDRKIGLNHPDGKNNIPFIRNAVAWLAQEN